MIKLFFKKILSALGIKPRELHAALREKFNKWSLNLSLRENGYEKMIEKLRKIAPDISKQEEDGKEIFNAYWELKRRALQAFQCGLMLKALNYFSGENLTVVDIGDSAGTHMLYLKNLIEGRFNIDSISVNLDPRAIKKIEARHLKAVLCRAEDLNLGGRKIDIYTSFEMVEHLHNPAIFFHRLAKKSSGAKLVITVPYLRKSRVGLYHLRSMSGKAIFAEDEHIFELSPEDWALLMLHSGWKIIYSQIYYQYPRRAPVIRHLLSSYWRANDFEGFWGAVLEKDTRFSDLYQNWE